MSTTRITPRMRDERERQRVNDIMRYRTTAVFVFGSNRAGVHGAGAAAYAARWYGAVRAVGEGRSGRSYAIPTKETWRDRALPLEDIAVHVDRFLEYARDNPLTVFAVTRIGCGFAGYTDAQVAPLFRDAPVNCELPDGWRTMGGAR